MYNYTVSRNLSYNYYFCFGTFSDQSFHIASNNYSDVFAFLQAIVMCLWCCPWQCMLLFYEGRWRRLTSKTTSSTTINEYCCTLSVFFYISRRNTKKMLVHVIKCYSLSCKGEFAMTGLPNLYLILKFLINSRPLDCTCSWRCNGLELCTRRISCFFAFSFPGKS